MLLGFNALRLSTAAHKEQFNQRFAFVHLRFWSIAYSSTFRFGCRSSPSLASILEASIINAQYVQPDPTWPWSASLHPPTTITVELREQTCRASSRSRNANEVFISSCSVLPSFAGLPNPRLRFVGPPRSMRTIVRRAYLSETSTVASRDDSDLPWPVTENLYNDVTGDPGVKPSHEACGDGRKDIQDCGIKKEHQHRAKHWTSLLQPYILATGFQVQIPAHRRVLVRASDDYRIDKAARHDAIRDETKLAAERLLRKRGDGLTWETLLEKLKSLATARPLQAAALTFEASRQTLKFNPLREVYGLAKPIHYVSADQIPWPMRWTTHTITKYIKDITSIKTARLIERKSKYYDTVVRLLTNLFSNLLETQTPVSIDACHTAITFLLRHRRTPLARELLVNMTRLGCPPTIDTFNIFLFGCASEQNIAAFDYFLMVAARRQLEPNMGTWIALLMLAHSAEAQEIVIAEIRTLGLAMQGGAAAQLAKHTIPYTVGPFLDQGGTISSYVNLLDSVFGLDWLMNIAVHPLLKALGERGFIKEAVEVITKLICDRCYKPNVADTTTLLSYCAKHLCGETAIWLVGHASKHWDFKLDSTAFTCLFRLAWDSRMYNVLRVVWKYACASGELEYWMEHTMYESLVKGLETDHNTPLKLWKASAAAVACGLEPSIAIMPAQVLLAELNMFGACQMCQPFVERIRAGMKLDMEWASQGMHRSKSTAWKVRHAIHIPQIPLRQTHLNHIELRVRHGKNGMPYRILKYDPGELISPTNCVATHKASISSPLHKWSSTIQV